MTSKVHSSFSHFRLEALFPLLVIVWRVLTYPITDMWKDWVVVISLYWLITIAFPKLGGRPSSSVWPMAYLLGIYVQGHVPHILRVIGFLP